MKLAERKEGHCDVTKNNNHFAERFTAQKSLGSLNYAALNRSSRTIIIYRSLKESLECSIFKDLDLFVSCIKFVLRP